MRRKWNRRQVLAGLGLSTIASVSRHEATALASAGPNERMNLAIVGNIVTAWSWFGVNMLGIGLHSYGFMDSAFYWLILFDLSQVSECNDGGTSSQIGFDGGKSSGHMCRGRS